MPDWASLPYTSISSTSSDKNKKKYSGVLQTGGSENQVKLIMDIPVQLAEDSTRFFLLGGSS